MSAASRSFSGYQRSAKSSTARAASNKEFPAVPTIKDLKYFTPCAATASMLLYVQGSSIICCHHDKLTISRIFTRHSDEIQLLAVDNHSELGAGRLVVSYDAGQTAIVWDLMTGQEMSRFASYEHLTTVAWMRNGNVVFGNTQGSIILFEPTTSEHISSRTIDQIPITALAPSSDCKTFAIGYSNGSLLVATLQPRFTILHNLTTSKAPSPIVTLAWHASSTRSKSDMLASQTHDGDLRVWSVTRSYNADDPAKVVRILRRNENTLAGPNWMGWSKNGRVIQHSDSETLSWDVRTKHVTHDSIPTLKLVRGIAVYGPGASLFTLGPNNTVQQFDLNSPAIMVANVQHPAGPLPPSPPTSDEIAGRSSHSTTTIQTSESESSSAPLGVISESEDDFPSSFLHTAHRPLFEMNQPTFKSPSPLSSQSEVSSADQSSTGSHTPGRKVHSLRSRGMTEHTHISTDSPVKSSMLGRKKVDNQSLAYSLHSTSVPSSVSSKSRHRPSKLRNEVLRSPDEAFTIDDLFKYTRSRLSDIPYGHYMPSHDSHLTNDDLRRQMLSTIFGWHGDVDGLVRDEMSRHSLGSPNRIMLARWLGETNADLMAPGSRQMTSSDWMLLALDGIGGQPSHQKLGRTFVHRLLAAGDLHVAVAIMLGLGDHNDGIEVYVSHKRYMEALLLTSLMFPGVWERQAAIIRRWGEWSVQHGQQQLAIRCFACTGQEPSEPWTSPSAMQLTFEGITSSIPEVLSPPLSPPRARRGPQRNVTRPSALRLITSFGGPNQKAKFYSELDGGQTPIAAGVTPIADCTDSPGATALHRPSDNSRFNTPTSARPSGSHFGRSRLPSIGETSREFDRNALQTQGRTTPVARSTRSVTSSHASASSAARSFRTIGAQNDQDESGHGLELSHHFPQKSSSRQGSRDRLMASSYASSHKSLDKRGHSREPPEERGRSSGRAKDKAKRSPTSPIPMSPQDLANLSARRFFDSLPEPVASRKADSGVGRGNSRASSRGSGKSKSKRRAQSASRTPSPMRARSATAMFYQGSEDEKDYQNAMQAREEFRLKHSRSVGRREPSETRRRETSETRRREPSENRRRREPSEARRAVADENIDAPAILSHSRAASTGQLGDLRQMKDERQRRKEQAARDLEERRRSLAKRQPVTAIPHPSEISPTKLCAAAEEEEDFLIEDFAPRCATESPRALYSRREQHHTGVPSSIKVTDESIALEPRAKEQPANPSNSRQESAPRPAPQARAEPPLTLLPSTVYQPPARMIPRSMSAPIPDDSSSSRSHRRKGSTVEMRDLGRISEQIRDEEAPTPSSLFPPRLKELQHLATPPPPPPIPLPHMPRSIPSGGAYGSGMIEIVMDDDDDDDNDDDDDDDDSGEPEESSVTNSGGAIFPPVAPAEASARGHQRGRSHGETSLSGHSSKAADLLQFATRGRKNSVKTQSAEVPAEFAALNQLRSPTSTVPPPVAMYDPDMVRLPYEYNQRSRGYSESQMF